MVLPDGSSEITHDIPFEVESMFDTKHWYFDYVGRPVLVLRKRNVVPHYNAAVHVQYRPTFMAVYRKILLFITSHDPNALPTLNTCLSSCVLRVCFDHRFSANGFRDRGSQGRESGEDPDGSPSNERTLQGTPIQSGRTAIVHSPDEEQPYGEQDKGLEEQDRIEAKEN